MWYESMWKQENQEIICENVDCRKYRSLGSSVSIVSDYGLDSPVIEVRSPSDIRGFFSNLCVRTGSGVHPDPCPVSARSPFPGRKAQQGHDADYSPHLVPRSWMNKSYTSSPTCTFVRLLWDCFTVVTNTKLLCLNFELESTWWLYDCEVETSVWIVAYW
jgi:hypothetical protein